MAVRSVWVRSLLGGEGLAGRFSISAPVGRRATSMFFYTRLHCPLSRPIHIVRLKHGRVAQKKQRDATPRVFQVSEHTRSARSTMCQTQEGELTTLSSASGHQCHAWPQPPPEQILQVSASAAFPPPCSSSHARTERVVVRQASVVTARAAEAHGRWARIEVSYHTKQQMTQHLRVLHTV